MDYILHICKKIKSIGFHHDYKAFYFSMAAVMFIMFMAGVVVGAGFFARSATSTSPQIDIAIGGQPVSEGQGQPATPGTQEGQVAQPTDQTSNQTIVQPPPSSTMANTPVPVDNNKSLVATVRRKDNLTRIFKRNGLNTKDAKDILTLKQAKALRKLHAGGKVSLTVEKTEKGVKLKKLTYTIDELNTLTVTPHGKGWRAQVKHVEPTVKLTYATTVIHGSVYTAASKKGIPRKVVGQLSDIFNKKVNLKKMHIGDRLAVAYKELFVDGKKIKDGEIVAAEIIHKDKKYRMVGFTDSKGITNYYTPEGYNSKPPFMRLPIRNYERISSRFSFNRYHPILEFKRPHRGVDFAAPRGTPIMATCNGKVDFVGTHGGHGRTIIIKRGAYKTLYAHLSQYAGDIYPGASVRQGQVIGYVGSSGLASGAHLHYEFQINGVPHDPLKVKLPEGEMIAPEYRKKFFALSNKLFTQLEQQYNEADQKILVMNELTSEEQKKS